MGGYDFLTTLEAGRANQRLSDEDQLSFATEQGRALVTHDVRDFMFLAKQWDAEEKAHAGIIVCRSKPVRELAERIRWYQDAYPRGIPGYLLTI